VVVFVTPDERCAAHGVHGEDCFECFPITKKLHGFGLTAREGER